MEGVGGGGSAAPWENSYPAGNTVGLTDERGDQSTAGGAAQVRRRCGGKGWRGSSGSWGGRGGSKSHGSLAFFVCGGGRCTFF